MTLRRKDRVEDQIKKEVSKIIGQNLKDPRAGFITITSVELSSDLRFAKIFFTVLGDEKEKEDSEKALTSATKFVQQKMATRIRLKYTPQIVFRYDHTLEQALRIEKILSEIQNEKRKKIRD